MGGTGADPLARDLSRLTPKELKVYEWAVQIHRSGVYPSDRKIARFLGHTGCGTAFYYRKSISRKVGWPFVYARRRSGTHWLTPFERSVLTMAWDLWDRIPREYPSLGVLCALIPRASRWNVTKARRLLIAKGIFPCKIEDRPGVIGAEIRSLVIEIRRSGCYWADIPARVLAETGKSVSRSTVWRILHPTPDVRGNTRQPAKSLADRMRTEIARRDGKAPKKPEDPAAYVKAVRATRRQQPSSRVRRVHSDS